MPYLFSLVLLLAGCSEHFEQFCTKERFDITCLKSGNYEAQRVIRQHFEPLQQEQCPFELTVDIHYAKPCNNPVNTEKSSEGGYVRLQLDYEGECYWRIQQSFDQDKENTVRSKLTGLLEQNVIQR